MEDFEKQLFDIYVEDYRIDSACYKMMGMMLEEERISKRIELHNIESVYIYGGGYLGVQLYNALVKKAKVKAIVDINGGLSVDVNGIRTITFEDLKKEYTGEKVIITPVKYYQTIKDSLMKFIDEDRILFLGEFLEGIV